MQVDLLGNLYADWDFKDAIDIQLFTWYKPSIRSAERMEDAVRNTIIPTRYVLEDILFPEVPFPVFPEPLR